MSASEGMYDVALKPKLLRSLLREYVPDEKHAFRNPSELSYVVATIKTHKLLSEWSPEAVEQDLADAWKLAVDSWVNRLLVLASSNLPDKCWAGICLLGLTSQECSSERLLASYPDWLSKLLSHIQHPAVSHFVKAASCAAISDLFTRLSGFSNVKKDATSKATKVIPATLKLLKEDSSAVVLEAAICLLYTMINFFPLSERDYNGVEAAIVSKLMSGICSATVLKKLGYGLSLLPKAKGDEDSWSLMMNKILLYIHCELNDAFQGIEEEGTGTQTMRALFPFGKEDLPPLGGLAEPEKTSELSTKRPERLLGSRISTLMQCCHGMLTNSYPAMVPVPVSGLIALAARVLMVDGSLSQSTYSFMTTLKPELICSELTLLQLHSLEILTALVKGLGSQLLPHVASIVQLLKEYLRICKLPELKIKAYSIVKALLMSMGVGIAIHIGNDIVSNVFSDLDFLGGEKDGKSSTMHSKVHSELLNESRQKKRKHSSIVKPSAHDVMEVEVPPNLISISVKIAALDVLEALLNVGGSMKSESWRANVDHLLITMATNACKEGLSTEEKNIFLCGNEMPMWADFQLAALRALLASLLSPGRARPPHLALGAELFRRGMQETGTKLAEYCGRALFTLEVLIHPRALPLIDSHSSIDEYKFLKQIPTYQSGTLERGQDEPESEEDDLNENWLGNEDEMEIQVTERKQEENYPEKSPVSSRQPSLDEFHSVKGVSNTSVPQNTEIIRNAAVEDRVNVLSETVSGKIALPEHNMASKSRGTPEVSEKMESTSPKQHDMETGDDKFDSIVERISATLLSAERGKASVFEPDREMSPDSLPDIVDGDPDSD